MVHHSAAIRAIYVVAGPTQSMGDSIATCQAYAVAPRYETKTSALLPVACSPLRTTGPGSGSIFFGHNISLLEKISQFPSALLIGA
jgi:hypothetical protein